MIVRSLSTQKQCRGRVCQCEEDPPRLALRGPALELLPLLLQLPFPLPFPFPESFPRPLPFLPGLSANLTDFTEEATDEALEVDLDRWEVRD